VFSLLLEFVINITPLPIILSSLSRLSPSADRANWVGLGLTLLIHALVLAFLLTYAPARDALNAIAPLMVQLIKPEVPAAPTPKPEPKVDKLPKPLPVKRVQPRPEPETPILAAQAPAANVPAVSVPPDPRPLPPVEARAAPPAPPATPAPIVPPNFNANYLDNPAPAYPPLSRRMGEEGKVLLRVHVEASGLPSKVEIRTSSGSERLDQAALEAVKRWKFVPARQGDQAVPAYVVVPISFSLRG
jgi:protein TonB